jgi:serine/threonine protein phosphatase PrpC
MRKMQEDYIGNVNDECFVVADGVGGMPHADTAAIVAGEAALWGYKHIRLRPFYWADKRLLLKRIFRSSNMTVWQKRREHGFETGLATTLSVAIIGLQKIWVGSVGDTSILLYREGLIDFLTPLDIDTSGNLTNALGLKRLGLVPHVTVEKFLPRDILLITTDGVTDYVKEEELRVTLELIGDTTQSVSDGASQLITIAQDHGSTDNMTVCMIKRVA